MVYLSAIITPGFKNRALDYQLACKVAEFFQAQGATIDFSKTCLLTAAKTDLPDLQTTWAFEDITATWSADLQGSWSYRKLVPAYAFAALPFKVVAVKADSILGKTSWALSRGVTSVQNWFGYGKPQTTSMNLLSAPFQHAPRYQQMDDLVVQRVNFLVNGAYTDAFTQLATSALQCDETPFIPEKAHQGSYCFVLKDNQLSLVIIPQRFPKLEFPDEDGGITPQMREIYHKECAVYDDFLESSKAALRAYQDFLIAAFGWRILDGVDGLYE